MSFADNVVSELVVEGAILIAGAVCWSRRHPISKIFGVLFFIAALANLWDSPELKAMILVFVFLVCFFVALVLMIKRQKKRRKQQREEREQSHIHIYRG